MWYTPAIRFIDLYLLGFKGQVSIKKIWMETWDPYLQCKNFMVWEQVSDLVATPFIESNKQTNQGN